MRSTKFLIKTKRPQIHIADGRAWLIMKDGGSSPFPLCEAEGAIERGEYVRASTTSTGTVYKHSIDM